jgi:hypothetical protein
MRIVPSLIAAAAALAVVAPSALAAPPVNDNYLASLPVDKVEFRSTVDLTEATTQPDIFNPSRDGQPLGGGTTENTVCKGTPFGKTAWFDLTPQSDGAIDVSAAGVGFTPVIVLYEWSQANSQITRLVDCTPVAGGRLALDVEKGRSYTIQLGAAGGIGGPATLSVDYFADTDGDGEYDALDKCPAVPGIARFGGCPPELRVVPSVGFDRTGNGVQISRLIVDRVPKGAKIVAKCSGCGSQTVKAKRFGRVSLSKLVGKNVRAGTKVEIRVTLGKSGSGTYVYGATGSYFEWPVRSGGLGARLTRCLNVKSSKIERCK